MATRESPSWTPYRFGFNNPIRFSDQGGTFEIDEATAKAYPKLNTYLQNLSSLYSNKTEDFRKVFRQYAKLNDQQIAKLLEYKLVPNGTPVRVNQATPRIEVADLRHPNGTGANGRTGVQYKTQNDIPIKVEATGTITLDKGLVENFELNYNSKSKISSLYFQGNVASEGAELLLESTVFHELTHYGDNLVRVPDDINTPATNDRGKQFETAVYGEDIGPSTDRIKESEGYVERKNLNNAREKDKAAKYNNQRGKDNLGGQGDGFDVGSKRYTAKGKKI